ncbi:hypothetical protein IX39_14450 [Chryseobacterium formosense]|uniref:Uncharacterized protein n=1 Tax=Chryseobacterium formosense TaxID=236814 RepID=A0A085Z2G7_9FLAO|nr:DUF6146 family protein [Chryseobacterium formosense]KFE98630.1 hypothetical protein IX39_14450 [Chryseobacterium formosense]SFT55642.1 hypothetical protein SAMN05421857_1586 [Chryseobacterium formosense]
MKNFFVLIVLIIIPLKLFAQNNPTNNKQDYVIKAEKNDDGEWDLIVIDTEFYYFINSIARPINYYQESYLKSRNASLVNIWNSYYRTGKYRDIIESLIDYNPKENYGIKFEYKLYQIFVYVHWKYKLRLNGIQSSDVFG